MHFMSFIHIEMAQVDEIQTCGSFVSNLSLFVNNIDADVLVTSRSRASAAILLT